MNELFKKENEKEALKEIKQRLQTNGEISISEVIDIITPHFEFDFNKEKEKAIRYEAQKIIAEFNQKQKIKNK